MGIIEGVTAAWRKIQPSPEETANTQEYESLAHADNPDGEDEARTSITEHDGKEPFSWFEYTIFLALGIAMLWAWNMFLAASPFFQYRFHDDAYILSHFQPTITSVASLTNFATTLYFNFRHSGASYPTRIVISLLSNVTIFFFLALSTIYMRELGSATYLVFVLFMVFLSSIATGLLQNSAFSFAGGFGRPEYIQAIVVGQAIAGVLPSLAQVVLVLAIPEKAHASSEEAARIQAENTATTAFSYFLTAAIVALISVVLFSPLIKRHKAIVRNNEFFSSAESFDTEQAERKSISQIALFKRVKWYAAALFLCFVITMFFPTFTQKILSVKDQSDAPKLFRPDAFIGLGFVVWNSADLAGRMLAALPSPLKKSPVGLLVLAVLRAGFVPLYLLCNISNKGAIISSDAFYLFIVQGGFGLTNGLLSNYSMTQGIEAVDTKEEKEAAGSFLVVVLMAGLMVGSLMSFLAAGA